MTERAALVKFGRLEHLIQLREEGLLYMNTLPYFWKLEEQEFRGDTFDGVDKIARGLHGEAITQDGTKFSVGKWFLRILPADAEATNIFSMYALRFDAGSSYPVDEKLLQFGDSALLIYRPQDFIDRIEAYRDANGVEMGVNLVEYVPDDHSGEIGPFRKLQRFQYQSEWRVVCYGGEGQPRAIELGSLADISMIVPSKEINDIEVPDKPS